MEVEKGRKDTLKKLLFFALINLILVLDNTLANQNFINVFVSGEDGYDTYRIPALIKTKAGTLLACCEGRKNSVSDSGNIDLVLKRSVDNGQTWSPMNVVWDDGENTCGNPCVVQDERTGEILLLMIWNSGDDTEMEIINGKSKDTRRVFITRSSDDGKTWTPPQEITTMVKSPDWTWYATGPGIGIQIKYSQYKGRIIIPCDHANRNDKQMYSHVIYSDDGGKTWKYSNPIGPKCNECQVVEIIRSLQPPQNVMLPMVVDLSNISSYLLLNMRNYNRNFKCRAKAYSSDGGVNWGPIEYDTALIEPNCQASIINFSKNPNMLVFSNPADENNRVKMTVKISTDGGTKWSREILIYEGPSAYSSLYQISDSEVGLLFECGNNNPYERIVFTRINVI